MFCHNKSVQSVHGTKANSVIMVPRLITGHFKSESFVLGGKGQLCKCSKQLGQNAIVYLPEHYFLTFALLWNLSGRVGFRSQAF